MVTIYDFQKLAAERDGLETAKQVISDRLSTVQKQLDAAAAELTRDVPVDEFEAPTDDMVPVPLVRDYNPADEALVHAA